MKIIARKCFQTGRVFRNEKNYLKHLKTLREENSIKRNKKRQLEEVSLKMSSVHSIRELEEILTDFARINYVSNNLRFDSLETLKEHAKQFSISFPTLEWSDICRNTHGAPPGKETNWHGNKELPSGYPGWVGRIDFFSDFKDWSTRYPTYHGFSAQVLPENDFIYVGSGGAGGYEVTLWAECFPELYAQRIEQILRNQHVFRPRS